MLDAFHRGAFVKLVSTRAMISLPWIDIESTVLFWKWPKTDSPRTYNGREERSSLAAVSVRVSCKRQYKSSSRFSARRAEVWTPCYQYTNLFPVLPFCFTLASTELRVPPLLPLVTTGAAVPLLQGHSELKQIWWLSHFLADVGLYGLNYVSPHH